MQPLANIDPWLLPTIHREHSAAMRKAVVTWVGTSGKRFSQLVRLVLHGSYVEAQRASYPMAFAAEDVPTLAVPHVAELLANLARSDIHGAVIRHTMRTFRVVKILPEMEGPLLNAALAAVTGPAEVAVKADAVSLLKRLVNVFPELQPEIHASLEEALHGASVALRSRIRKEFRLC